jgi:hypothetical protein
MDTTILLTSFYCFNIKKFMEALPVAFQQFEKNQKVATFTLPFPKKDLPQGSNVFFQPLYLKLSPQIFQVFLNYESKSVLLVQSSFLLWTISYSLWIILTDCIVL